MADLATKSQREIIAADDVSPGFLEDEESRRKPHTGIETLAILWNARKTLLRSCVLGAVLSSLIAFLIPKRYDSVARLMPPDQSNPSTAMLAALTGGIGGGRGSGVGALAGDLLGLKSTGDMFIGVLQSRSVEDALINKFDLRKIYRDRHIEDAREDLEKRTSISAERKSGIITIRVTDRDPKRAAAMNQEYVDQLNRVVTHLNTTSAGREREFLEQRLVQVKSDLERAEKGFSEFASKNTAIDIPSQGKAMIEAAATLEGELIATQTELESVRQIYTDSNVRVRALRAKTEELTRQLQKLGGVTDGASAGSPDSRNQPIPSIRQLPLLGVPYADLYRNTKVQEAIYETLTEEYELAKVQEVKETPSVKVLDPPDVPEEKSFPPRLLIILLGTALAFSTAVTWVVSIRLWSAIDSADPRRVLANEVASSIRDEFGQASQNRAAGEWLRSIWSWLRFERGQRGQADPRK